MLLDIDIYDLTKEHKISEAHEKLLYESIQECSTTSDISKEIVNEAIKAIRTYELIQSKISRDELHNILLGINT
ncbi:hypothetical protein HUO05_03560 [Vibrio alginolyticus]|uniref:hypothetical protein n=1 Tax=Vibrio alginolyticus TaxID=663 RepID=UPI0015932E89|nr:hypothetical protein [Vibrio alginolyticus]QKS94350.1 hypothetical protein HUO05_03560 [Vibrio alginolyticus]HCZ9033976.1 hypothetical protein [Vibrio alginolyticus]HCZ9053037.1 hypothetical protein [Vibrio alginolyticus]